MNEELVVEEVQSMEPAYYNFPLSSFPPDDMLLGPDFDARQLATLKAGVEHPVSVTVDKDLNIIRVRDGRKRIKGLRKLGFSDDYELLALTHMSTPEEDAIASLMLNHVRKPNPVTDYISSRDLILKFGFSEKKIAELTGMTKAEVKRIMQIHGLSPVLREGFLDGRVKPGVAVAAARRSQEEQDELGAILIDKQVLTGEDVQNVRRAGFKEGGDLLQTAMFEQEPATESWNAWKDPDGLVTIVLPSGERYSVANEKLLKFLRKL